MTRVSYVAAVLVGVAFLPVTSAAQEIHNLSFPIRDLRFETQDLTFALGDLEFPVEDIAEPVETPDEVRFRLAADVLFDYDSAELRPEAEPVLEQMAERIRAEFAGETVRVEGHTDAAGSTEYNQGLSERRAESVKRWLVERGQVPEELVTTVGFGESQPVVPNQRDNGSDDPIGRQQNRRVEIVVERTAR